MLLNETTTFFSMFNDLCKIFSMCELALSTAEGIKNNPVPCIISETVNDGLICTGIT